MLPKLPGAHSSSVLSRLSGAKAGLYPKEPKPSSRVRSSHFRRETSTLPSPTDVTKDERMPRLKGVRPIPQLRVQPDDSDDASSTCPVPRRPDGDREAQAGDSLAGSAGLAVTDPVGRRPEATDSLSVNDAGLQPGGGGSCFAASDGCFHSLTDTNFPGSGRRGQWRRSVDAALTPRRSVAPAAESVSELLSRSSCRTRSSLRRPRRQPGYYVDKFRRLGKFLTIFIGLWRKHAARVKEFLDTSVQLVTYDLADDVLFDVMEYRAEKHARVSNDTKRILMKKAETRTVDEIHYVEVALRNYTAMAACPVRIQTMVAARGWYERFVGRRIVIRQGHRARNFYFILSGSVVITRMEENSSVSRTLCYLNRGDSFGELGIIANQPRSATAISEGTVELLAFSEEDYWEIFRYGGLKNTNDPLLSNVGCLHDWPVELLADNTEKAVMCFRRRGQVLVEDSQKSEWIYIVKSGSCTVLKKLRKVKPARARKRRPLPPVLDPESHCAYLERLLREGDSSKRDSCGTARRQRELVGLGLSLPGLQRGLEQYTDEQIVKKPQCESETDEVFVAIQTLSKGDVFGLADLVYGQQPKFSLVSNGAECIMIDKRFYLDRAPQALMRRLRAEVSPYPSDSDLQTGLERHVNWERHKAVVWRKAVDDATASKHAAKERRQRSMVLALLQ